MWIVLVVKTSSLHASVNRTDITSVPPVHRSGITRVIRRTCERYTTAMAKTMVMVGRERERPGLVFYSRRAGTGAGAAFMLDPCVGVDAFNFQFPSATTAFHGGSYP